MANTIFELIANKVREALENPLDYLPPIPQSNFGTALNALDNAAGQVASAADLDAWLTAADGFRNALSNVATSAFGSTPAETRDDLFARFLLTHLPRTGASLIVLGIITASTDAASGETHYSVDWSQLEQFIRDLETLVNKQSWENLFADVGQPHSGRLPAIIAGILLMAPRTIVALVQGNLKVAGLPPPPVRVDPNSPWGRFRQASEDWISFTLPLGDPLKVVNDPVDPRYPANRFQFQSDMEPDLSATLAVRSNRHQVGGNTVTDFEMWLGFGVDRDKWEYEIGEHWFVRVVPGLTVGFGKDGQAGTWHGAFAPLSVNGSFLPSRPDDPVTISIDRDVPGGLPDIQLGPPYDTRLVIQDLGAWIKLREATPVFEIALRVKELEAVLAPRWFRVFGEIDETFREGISFKLDFDFVYGIGTGAGLNLSSGLEALWVLNKQLGDESLNIKLHSIRFIGELVATINSFHARLNARIHASGQLGPVGLVIDGPGAWVGYWPVDGEMKYWGLLPPTGAGLSLEIGPIIGGGFLDWRGGPTERYAGLLYAKIFNFEVIAFGIHEKTAAGRTSLVLVLGARFSPGIQLGFGFAITMTVFVITGDAVFRLSFGDRPYAMFSLGGFHPDFNPEPAQFPELARLGLRYDPPGGIGLFLRLEFYFAITTNSVQLGGRVEVGFKAGPINAVGWVALDVLIQFRPFLFSVGFSAGFRVRWKSTTLAGVRCAGTISGPGPVTVTGEFCIEILFFDICWSDSFTIGSGSPDVATTVSSLRQALAPELSKPSNLEAIGTEDRLVTAHSQLIDENANLTVVSPLGRLQWTQKRAPLNCLIERFEGAPLASPQAVEISSPVADGGKVKDWFSPGSFTNLNNSEKLNRASFERLEAGLTLGFDVESADPVARNLSVNTYYLPRPQPVVLVLLTQFPSLVVESIYGRTASTSTFQRHEATVKIKDEGWSVRAQNGSVMQQGISQTDAHQRARYAEATALPDNDEIDLEDI